MSYFTGVLVTRHRKHLLVDNEVRRTACDKVMRTGKVYEADFDELALWNDEAPLQCPECAEAWEQHEEWKRMRREE